MRVFRIVAADGAGDKTRSKGREAGTENKRNVHEMQCSRPASSNILEASLCFLGVFLIFRLVVIIFGVCAPVSGIKERLAVEPVGQPLF